MLIITDGDYQSRIVHCEINGTYLLLIKLNKLSSITILQLYLFHLLFSCCFLTIDFVVFVTFYLELMTTIAVDDKEFLQLKEVTSFINLHCVRWAAFALLNCSDAL